jgi:hypothetical protein
MRRVDAWRGGARQVDVTAAGCAFRGRNLVDHGLVASVGEVFPIVGQANPGAAVSDRGALLGPGDLQGFCIAERLIAAAEFESVLLHIK